MASLLHLDSSADVSTSRTRAMTAAFAKAFTAASDGNTVVYRDLHAQPLPHLADASLHWAPQLRLTDAPPPVAVALQQELLDELVAADVLLVGAPLYNYSLPSALKAWIDHIHVPGVTAPFGDATQPMKGRRAVVAVSRGTAYGPGAPNEGNDHAVPVLELILGEALGMSVKVLAADFALATKVEAMAAQRPQSEAEYAAALEAAAALGSELGS